MRECSDASIPFSDQKVRFSLVVATFGRTDEVRDLLRSLADQIEQKFEVIVVDQNVDDRLVPVVAAFAGQMRLQHLRSDVRQNSHARNLGIRVCSGEIIGFPDDDCLYPTDVLRVAYGQFTCDSTLTFVSGPAVTAAGQLGSGRWTTRSGPISMTNVWTTVIEFNFFAKRADVLRVGSFDEDLGIGARFGSAEGTDLAIRLLRGSGKGYYNFSLRVLHPDKTLTPRAVERAFDYGTGLGRVLRKHGASFSTILTFAIRPLGGAAVSLLRRRTLSATYYWMTLRGRLAGFLATPERRGRT